MPPTTKRKTWDADAETTQLKLNAKSGALVQFTDNFHILHGNEEPELYLQFCMIFRERINLNVMKRELQLKMCSGAVKQADLFLCLNDGRNRRLLDKGTR